MTNKAEALAPRRAQLLTMGAARMSSQTTRSEQCKNCHLWRQDKCSDNDMYPVCGGPYPLILDQGRRPPIRETNERLPRPVADRPR